MDESLVPVQIVRKSPRVIFSLWAAIALLSLQSIWLQLEVRRLSDCGTNAQEATDHASSEPLAVSAVEDPAPHMPFHPKSVASEAEIQWLVRQVQRLFAIKANTSVVDKELETFHWVVQRQSKRQMDDIGDLRKDINDAKKAAEDALASSNELKQHLPQSVAALQSSQQHLSLDIDTATKVADNAKCTAENALTNSNELKQLLGLCHDDIAALQTQQQRLSSEIDAVAEAANKAKSLAGSAVDGMAGVAFVKRVGGCPLGSYECVLWHWYNPDPWDPFCGHNHDSADGRCFADRSGNFLTEMRGCCRD